MIGDWLEVAFLWVCGIVCVLMLAALCIGIPLAIRHENRTYKDLRARCESLESHESRTLCLVELEKP